MSKEPNQEEKCKWCGKATPAGFSCNANCKFLNKTMSNNISGDFKEKIEYISRAESIAKDVVKEITKRHRFLNEMPDVIKDLEEIIIYRIEGIKSIII